MQYQRQEARGVSSAVNDSRDAKAVDCCAYDISSGRDRNDTKGQIQWALVTHLAIRERWALTLIYWV